MKLFTGVLSALTLMLGAAAPAQADSLLTFVSGNGNDTNLCTRAQPCQTFSGAIAKTSVNGIVSCLDIGNFLGVGAIITKSITIDCHEMLAGAYYTSGNGFNIDFDSFTSPGEVLKTVRLRNLSLNGIDSAGGGIRISGGSSVTGGTVIVEDCVIEGNAGRGIDDVRSGGGKLIVNNTTIRNNRGAGISVLPAGGSSNIQVLLNNVRSYANGTGGQFGNLTRVMIDQSAFTTNTGAGILTVAGAVVDIDRSTMSHNANGVQAVGGVIAVANSNVKLNTSQGVNVSGGTVFSFGNNRIAFNASPGSAPTPAGGATSDLGQQ